MLIPNECKLNTNSLPNSLFGSAVIISGSHPRFARVTHVFISDPPKLKKKKSMVLIYRFQYNATKEVLQMIKFWVPLNIILKVLYIICMRTSKYDRIKI